MKKVIFAASLIFFCLAFVFSQEKESEAISLTLNDCLLKALENNFDVLVEAVNPEIKEFSLRQSREKFMPQLSFGYDNLNYNYLSSWYVAGTQYTTKTIGYSLGLSQNIVTGGEISLDLSSSSTDTTQKLMTINPTYIGELGFGLKQPLLKNFGPKVSRRDIIAAQNQRDISVYGLKSTLIQKVYDVEQAYWSLVYNIESLKVNESSLKQSKEQLEKTKEAAKIGTKTSLDILLAETEVASWESRIISVRSQVENAEEKLRELINLPSDGSGITKPILPVDKPVVEKKEITFEQALKTALEESPDIGKYQKEIENSSLDVSYYKNQLLPQLDLNFKIWYPGQSGDILIYQNNDPFTGIVVDRIKGSRTNSLKDVFNLTYQNWYITLSLNIPLQNIFSRASLAAARMEKEQKQLEMEKQRKSVYNALLAVFKELKNNEKMMDTSRVLRELREKKLQAEEERVRLGLAVSSEWLFQYQRDVASAKTDEIWATINYKISVANLEKIMGVNLKSKNLKFKDYDF
jgi:outer membrane protein TolC